MNNTLMYILISLIVLSIIVTIVLYMKLLAKIRLLNSITKKLLVQDRNRIEEISKIRKRYIVFSIVSNRNFDKQLIEKTIRETYRKFFGEFLLIQADPQLIYFDSSLQRGIVRTTHLHKDLVIVTLSLIREIDGNKCLIIPLKTTGTIKKARRVVYRLYKRVGKT